MILLYIGYLLMSPHSGQQKVLENSRRVGKSVGFLLFGIFIPSLLRRDFHPRKERRKFRPANLLDNVRFR